MKTEENKKDTPQPSIARLLKEDLEKKKQQMASFLTSQLQRLSPRERKLFFFFTGIALGLVILAMSYYSVHCSTAFDFLRNEKVTPMPANPTDEEIVTPGEYQIMIDFTKTLDSLKQRDPFSYRKLMDIHPGLLDSMSLLMRIYQSTH